MLNKRTVVGFASLLFLALPLDVVAQEALTGVSEANGEGSFLSDMAWSGHAGLNYGVSSNAGLLSEADRGSYLMISPGLSLDWEPKESVIFTLGIESEWKRYSDILTQNLGNENFLDIRVELLSFLEDGWEWGAEASYSRTNNRVPFVDATGLSNAVGQEFTEIGGRAYLAWFGDSWSVEGAANLKRSDYFTNFTDRQGNVFENDYSEWKGEINVGNHASDTTKYSLKNYVGQRIYREKTASFSEGLEPILGAPHPELKLFFHEHHLGMENSWTGAKLRSSIVALIEYDRVFGADSSQRVRLTQSLAVPLTKELSWTPSYSISRRSFTRFRSDPVNNAESKPTRLDIEAQLASKLSWNLSSLLSLNTKYSFQRLVSNYAILTYSEHVIESGLTAQF